MSPVVPSGGDRQSARLAVLVVLGAAALAFLWRMPATPVEWSFIRCENDSLFHLHRVQQALQSFPLVPSIDRFSKYPEGFRVLWLTPHTLAYASVARVFGLDGSDLAATQRVVSWIPPILGALAVVLVGLLTRCFSSNLLVLLVAVLLAALMGETVRPFFFGTIDHHLFAHLGVLAAALGRLRRRLWLWSLGMFALCAMTPEAILYVTLLLALVFAAEWLAQLDGAPASSSANAYLVAPAAVGFIALLLHRVLQSDPLPFVEVDWTQPTLFQPAWYAALGGSMALGLRRGSTENAGVSERFLPPLLVVVVALLFLWSTGTLAGIGGRLGGAPRIFVGEEAFVFRNGWLHAHPWYQFVSLLAVVYAARLGWAVREREGADALFGWMLLLVALTIGFLEYRHLYVLSGLQAVAVAVALGEAAAAIGAWNERVAAPALALFAVAVLVPFLTSTDVMNRAALRAGACDALPVNEEVAAWLRAETPPAAASEDEQPTYGVFAAWSNGHQLHVLGERPVVVDPFNYDTRDRTEKLVEQIWLTEDEAALRRQLRALGVRYLVLTNPAEEIVGAARRRGLAAHELYRRGDAGFDFLPGMSRYAAFRLFAGANEIELAGFALRYDSSRGETVSLADPSGAVRRIAVPRARIYELVSTSP